MNLLFEFGVPLALVVGAWIAIHLVRRTGDRIEEKDRRKHIAGE